MGTPRKNPDSIEAILCDIRNYGKNDTKYARKLLVKLTGKDNWTEQQCEQVYDAILQQYLDDERYLNLMRDVSGQSKGYQCIANITDRRIKYLEEHNDKRDHESLAKNEERHCIEYITGELQKAINNGTILRLVEKWTSEKNNTGDGQTDNSRQLQNKNEQSNNIKEPQSRNNLPNSDSHTVIINNSTTVIFDGDAKDNTVIAGGQGGQTATITKEATEIELLKKIGNALVKWCKNNPSLTFGILIIVGCATVLIASNIPRFSESNISSNTSQVSAISVSPSEVILKPGETYTIQPNILPETVTNAKINYTSSNTSIASVHKTEGIVLAQDNWDGEDVQTVDISISADNDIEESKRITVIREQKDNPVEAAIQTNVRKVGAADNTWESLIKAEIDDILEYQILYENKSSVTQNYVTIRDILPASLEYIPGSTKLGDNAYSDGITDDGIDIGSYAPGATASVYFRAKIIDTKLSPGKSTLINRVYMGKQEEALFQKYAAIRVEYTPDFTLQVSVRFADTTGDNWTDGLHVEIGDELEYQILYRNTSNVDQSNVMLCNVLPNNIAYIPNSTKLWNEDLTGATATTDNLVNEKGINIGNYAPGANAYVRFRAKVVSQDSVKDSNTLINWAYGSTNGKLIKDSVIMTLSD